ncbi:TPA: protease complex subunit PrcB family protein [Candidatus Woesearchaeota archaeon]|nr:protease complex subunit PrcB family protein [Candidatus Woesearchaeota archaeon]
MSDRLSFETIQKGNYSGHRSPADYVVKDARAWQKLWEQTHSNATPEPNLPVVDFNREMVLGVYLGQRNRGGYDIKISDLVEGEGHLEVMVVETTPGLMATNGLTQSYHLIKTARTDREIKFVR